jgi:hypothetical protein
MKIISKKALRSIAVIVSGLVVSGYLLTGHIYSFLSLNAPIEAQVLVVEGWMKDLELKKAAEHLLSSHYELVIVTGGPLERGSFLSEYKTFADLGRATLLTITARKDIIAVPAPSIQKDRTYASALALKRWLDEKNAGFDSVNIVSSNVHARRSRYLFKRALGNHYKVGIIAIDSLTYDGKAWWSSSQGFKEVVYETIAYLYTGLLFPFYNDSSPQAS